MENRRINKQWHEGHEIDRRGLLQRGALGAGALVAGAALGPAGRALARRSRNARRSSAKKSRPNFLFIISDQRVNQVRFRQFTTDEQWRYYIYVYYRQVEMLDADVGRILNGLEAAGQAENTIVILTSDHGEGRGRHQNVQKWHPYDEAMKVPMSSRLQIRKRL